MSMLGARVVAALMFFGVLDACDLTLVHDHVSVVIVQRDRDELRCRYAGRRWDAAREVCF